MILEKDKEYVDRLKERCDMGDLSAMEELAAFYYEDHRDLMNDTKICEFVLSCYEKCAAAGSQKAQLNLGTIYYDGLYVNKDCQKAAELFKLCASGDSARLAAIADAKLGDCYFYGYGKEQDYSRAFDCYLEGILLCDHPACLYKLGDMYRYGLFVNQSSERAYFIYSEAKKISAERFLGDGYAEVLIRLAEAKIDGTGTERDLSGALKYLEIAKRTPRISSHPENIQEKVELLREKIKNL